LNTNRVMIVTGASSGIGRALAERAARAGYDVFAVGRDRARLAALENAVALATGKVSTLALDLRMRGAAQRIARAAAERFGRIDVVVNAAGAVAVGPISQQSDAALREQLQVHVLVPLALVREALAALRASRGHVFFFGSGVARIPVGKLGAYPSAKAAVRSMTRIVRNELRADGIAVTYVDPGAVATEFMTRAGFAGPPEWIAASPYAVANRIFDALRTRPNVVNAVPWQTLFVALGEALPNLTDYLLARNPEITGIKPAPQTPAMPPPTADFPEPGNGPEPPEPKEPASSVAPERSAQQGPLEPAPAAESPSELEMALAPLLPRMRRLKLGIDFVAGLLQPSATLELGNVAMRWAGMPNKNERGLARDVLELLAEKGYLTRQGDDVYTVARPAG
jgi:short-subunit dehydrogenase